ncbi:MAG: histidine kinase [Flavobacteriales bacterium]|nr:histidine kinase [Flavobacteriales bacterium]
MRTSIGSALVFCCAHLFGQYPLVRTMEVLDGQQGVNATCLTQDFQGLLWLGSDRGLFRTDGDRTDAILRTEGDVVTAIGSAGDHVVAALASGVILRCSGLGCDTLWTDTTFRDNPVRSLVVDPRNGIWAGTYGSGTQVWRNGKVIHVNSIHGLSDDHVNAQCVLDKDRMALATDQGISIIDLDGVVQVRYGEKDGAPDNLVLSICTSASGRLWAGTDRGGVFTFDPDHIRSKAERLDSNWIGEPVTHLVSTLYRSWIGTTGKGTVVCDASSGLAYYRPTTSDQGAQSTIKGLLRDRDGAVWWCDGSSTLRRADPDVVVTPQHEGFDMHRITALAQGTSGRITFATRDGVFTHATTFREAQRLERVQLPIDSTTQVVALHTDHRGQLWAGTFGKGVFRIAPDGSFLHLDKGFGSINENVLSIRSRGDSVLFATIGGVFLWTCSEDKLSGRFSELPIPGGGFTYDILPMPDGSILVATDGNGVVRIDEKGVARSLLVTGGKHRTFYSLCVDSAGQAWACGPETGICRVDPDGLTLLRSADVPNMNDVFAMVPLGPGLALMGEAGLVVWNNSTSLNLDLTNEFGLRGAKAELNTVAVDASGSVWLASDQGLIRIDPAGQWLSEHASAVVLSVRQGGEALALIGGAELTPGHDFLSIRFTGIHYAAPEDLRFAYRLIGSDTTVHFTRDHEISFAHLPAGEYRFEVAASTGMSRIHDQWTSFAFTVLRPWWRTPWAFLAALGSVAAIVILLLRARDARLRLKERMEKEKVHFQMEVLRSQVNPHFLFNSFNTLIELIEEAPSKAVKHVEQLSDFFREILQVRDKELIPLRDELRLVDTYFFLEQRRFGDRIVLRTSVVQSALDALVPPLTVQLLVENALKHNRATDEEPLIVTISTTRDELTVSNPYRPRETAAKSTGFGVNSIRQRFSAVTQRETFIGQEGDNFVARVPLIPSIA